jgi:uncharacterized membrane protein (DUF4010 family)
MEPLIARLGLALAIGLLVGLERGWRERDAPEHSRTAGIRTFGLVGLLGGIFAALSQAAGSSAILVAGFLGFAAIFSIYKYHEAERDEDYSVTSVVAALVLFALGALAVVGDYIAAAAGGAALASVLASREVLHGLLRKLTWVEVRSALVLAAMTAIVLPVLPNRTIDPWGGLNPWEIWFFTVLMAAISFLGYAAVRMLGPARGLSVSALAGALVSSTAVTVALARMAKHSENAVTLAGAASLAAMVSLLRVLLVTTIVQASVAPAIMLPALSAALVFAGAGLLLMWRDKEPEGTGSEPPRNPFEIFPLLAFAVIFAIVATASALAVRSLGTGGVIATTAFSGAFDVDVATLGVLRLVSLSTVPIAVAGQAVLGAVAMNAVVRVVLAAAAGPVRFWMPLLLATLAAAGTAAAVYALSPWPAN